MKKQKIKCPDCKNIALKYGQRKNKNQIIQRYKCSYCNKTFTLQQTKYITYPINIILKAISTYNLGYNLKQTQNKLEKVAKTKVPVSTISSWLQQYKNICTFNKLRTKAIKLYAQNNIIFKKALNHIQPYTFKYHKAKLELLFKDIKYNNQFINQSKFYEPIKNYLEKISTDKFPHHIFKEKTSLESPDAEVEKEINSLKNKNAITASEQKKTAKTSGSNADVAKLKDVEKNKLEQRASQLKFKTLKIKKLKKTNLANKLAKLALNLATTNKERHQIIQDFMLINDSTTIAVEVPVYLTNDDIKYFIKKGFKINLENYTTPITGHIDILQIRNGLIHILDYKPEAIKSDPIEQLTIYALALASRTKLAVKDFKCAWFDNKNYFEFFPLHTVKNKTPN